MHVIRADVVIAGGGPVGLLLAAELGGYGVRTVVLEARATRTERPKATTVHARTVQTLARRGYLPGPGLPVAQRERGKVRRAFHFAGVQGLDIIAPASEPEPILKCPQAELERQFEERARALGVRVLRGHRVTGIQQRQDGVRVMAAGPRGRTAYEAAYTVGADGSHSTVRELAGIASDTGRATASAMMGLVRVAPADVLPPGWHRTPRGWVVAKATSDGATHIRTLDCTRCPTRRSLDVSELARETSRILGQDIAMSQPRWLSRFNDFSRLARAYRWDRTLLVGDAAHVHFPVGGQGLSTGLLDALNLGWKLALTVRGQAGAGLLDTYDTERRPAAQRVIDNVRTQVTLMRPDRAPASLSELVASGGSFDPARIGLMISAQDTVLPRRSADPSPWEGRFLDNRAVATTAGRTDVIRLLGDRRLLLLRFARSRGVRDAESIIDPRLVRLVDAEPPAGLDCSALLVRPDGYIAWAPSDGAYDLRRALLTWCAPAGGIKCVA